MNKLLSRTGRSATWMALAYAIMQIVEHYARLDKDEFTLWWGLVSLVVTAVVNGVESGIDKHFLEVRVPAPTGDDAFEPGQGGHR